MDTETVTIDPKLQQAVFKRACYFFGWGTSFPYIVFDDGEGGIVEE